MKQKVWTIGKVVGILVLLVVGLTFLIKDYNQNVTDSSKEKKELKLNVAIVNEDQGIKANNQQYNLGANYVKKIENDKTQNYAIVSRGIADSGLKNGDYQVSVVIPSNFSAKIMDINQVQPSSLNVEYKINPNGNVNVENRSKVVGEKIIKDLNEQLTNMYVVSILDNLYTAQTNVQKVANVQNKNINDYKGTIYTETNSFTDQHLPDLLAQSKASNEANDALGESLKQFALTDVSNLQASEKETNESLADLVQQRADGKLTYADFQKKLLTMDSDLLSQETKTIQVNLQQANTDLTKKITDSPENAALEQSFQEMEQKVKENQDTVKKYQDELAAKQAAVEQIAKEKLQKQFNLQNLDDDITLRAYLNKQTNSDGTALDDTTKGDETQSAIDGVQNDQTKRFEGANAALALLPYSYDHLVNNQPAALGDNAAAITEQATTIQNSINKVNASSQANPVSQGTILTYNDNTEAAKKMDDAYFNYLDKKVTKNFTIKVNGIPEAEEGEEEKTGTFTLNAPDTVDVTYDGIQNGDVVKNGDTIKFSVTIPAEATGNLSIAISNIANHQQMEVTVADTSNTDQSFWGNSWEANWSIPSLKESDHTYNELYKAYTSEQQHVKGLYETAAQLIQGFDNYNAANYQTLADLMNTPIKATLMTILKSAYSDSNNDTNAQLAAIESQAQAIEAQKTDLMTKNDQVQTTNTAILNDIQKQAGETNTAIEEWQKQMDAIQSGESTVAKDNDTTDSQAESNKKALEALMQQSQALRESSEQNVKEASSVKEVFTTFDQKVKTAQSDSKGIQSNANALMDKFQDELNKNNDFVGSFVKVLNNAYKDGVSNDKLIQFISNPVNGASDTEEVATKEPKTVDTSKSFTWILLIFVVAFFLAYSFTNENLVRRVKDVFRQHESWVQNNFFSEIFLVGSSVVAGLILGFISLMNNVIGSSYQVGWVLVVTGLTVFFTLLNHYLFQQLRILGVAISLFALVSYVFVSGATGNIGAYQGASAWLRKINPLAFGEKLLNRLFNSQFIGYAGLFALIFLIVAFLVLNLFIWKKNPKQDGVTAV